MEEITKGKSPFYPGQPVPVELFVGRADQIERIMRRGVGQVSQGKPVAVYVQGEYGIGKSSIAGFTQRLAEKEYGVHGIYATLGGVKDITDVVKAVLEATLRSGAFNPTRSEKLRNWLAKYIGEQKLFGFTINAEALKRDAPNFSTPFGMLDFLSQVIERLKDTGVKGIFLVLDEINGITGDHQFSHLIKGIIDTNALAPTPVPLLLMICGVEERRQEMILKHRPIERIFDIVEIDALNEEEMQEFFQRAFSSVNISIENSAMSFLTHFSAGFPKIMHLVGDAAYWIDKDNKISDEDATSAIIMAAEDVGSKYVDQQVYRALKSKDYQSILSKIARFGPAEMKFTKDKVASKLTEIEESKFSNFLQRMMKLKVIRKGEIRGEYIFNNRMVRLYIWLESSRKVAKNKSNAEFSKNN
jgi:hypothetical protein